MRRTKRLSDDDTSRLLQALLRRKRRARFGWDRLAKEVGVARKTLNRWFRGGAVSCRIGASVSRALGLGGGFSDSLLSASSPFACLRRFSASDTSSGFVLACQAGAWIVKESGTDTRLEADPPHGCLVTKTMGAQPVARARLTFRSGFLSYSLTEPGPSETEVGSGAATASGLGFCVEFMRHRVTSEKENAAALQRVQKELKRKFV